MADRTISESSTHARIDRVVELMSRGEYGADATDRLAEEFGVGARTVQSYIQAARYHLARIGEQELVLEKVRRKCESIIDEGIPVVDKEGRVVGYRPPPDRVQAMTLLLKSYGMLREKVDVTISGKDEASQIRALVSAFRQLDPVSVKAIEKVLLEDSNNKLKAVLRDNGWLPPPPRVIDTEGDSDQ